MGSLSSTPKAPQNNVVYTPAPTASVSVAETSITQKRTAEVAAESREKSLLSRNRGRFGTIATSLQGFLGEANSSGRKTLLGE